MPETAHFWKDSKRQEFLFRATLFDFLKYASETKTQTAQTPVTLPSCSHRTGTSQSSSNVNGQEKEGSGSSLDPMTRCTLGTPPGKERKVIPLFYKSDNHFLEIVWNSLGKRYFVIMPSIKNIEPHYTIEEKFEFSEQRFLLVFPCLSKLVKVISAGCIYNPRGLDTFKAHNSPSQFPASALFS